MAHNNKASMRRRPAAAVPLRASADEADFAAAARRALGRRFDVRIIHSARPPGPPFPSEPLAPTPPVAMPVANSPRSIPLRRGAQAAASAPPRSAMRRLRFYEQASLVARMYDDARAHSKAKAEQLQRKHVFGTMKRGERVPDEVVLRCTARLSKPTPRLRHRPLTAPTRRRNAPVEDRATLSGILAMEGSFLRQCVNGPKPPSASSRLSEGKHSSLGQRLPFASKMEGEETVAEGWTLNEFNRMAALCAGVALNDEARAYAHTRANIHTRPHRPVVEQTISLKPGAIEKVASIPNMFPQDNTPDSEIFRVVLGGGADSPLHHTPRFAEGAPSSGVEAKRSHSVSSDMSTGDALGIFGDAWQRGHGGRGARGAHSARGGNAHDPQSLGVVYPNMGKEGHRRPDFLPTRSFRLSV
eukprot:Hpha_TRINITY_DN22162_c0_g1::TRINITY_DN22162_c0_g1_i1::g.103630::m.103630